MLEEKLSQTIYISSNEEITMIIEKLAKSRLAKVFLIIPPHSLLLQSPINLRILKEETEARRIDLTLIAVDNAADLLCKKAGLKCRQSILGQRKQITEQKNDIPEKNMSENADHRAGRIFEIFKNKIIYVLPFSLAAAALIFANFFLPSASIFILAKDSFFEKNIDAKISLLSNEGSELPFKIAESKEEFLESFPTTGKKIIEEYSSGEVIVMNEWDSSDHFFPAGTKIISEKGKIFKFVSAVTVGGFSRSGGKDIAGKALVKIKADAPGAEYNIDVSKFFILPLKETEKYDKIYAVSGSKTLGGRIGSEKIVSEEDIINANKVILEHSRKENPEKFQIGEKEFIAAALEGKVSKASFSSKTGDAAASLNVNAEIIRKAIVLKEGDLNNFVENYLKSDVLDIKISMDSFEGDERGGILKIKLEGKDSEKIDIYEVKKMIAGKSRIDAEKILGNLSIIEKNSVKLWPFWIFNVPSGKDRINVFLDRNNYFSIIN